MADLEHLVLLRFGEAERLLHAHHVLAAAPHALVHAPFAHGTGSGLCKRFVRRQRRETQRATRRQQELRHVVSEHGDPPLIGIVLAVLPPRE